MRAEQIINEAKLFSGPEECYIHAEHPRGGDFMIMISGDPQCMLQAVYNILSRMHDISGVPLGTLIRFLAKANKMIGPHRTSNVIEKGEIRTVKSFEEKHQIEIHELELQAKALRDIIDERDRQLSSFKAGASLREKEYKKKLKDAEKRVLELEHYAAELEQAGAPTESTDE